MILLKYDANLVTLRFSSMKTVLRMINLPLPKGALFDLDGVIIDSESLYSLFWDRVGEEYSMKDRPFGIAIKGMTLVKILEMFPREDHEEIKRRIHEYEDHMVYTPFPGALEYLDYLRKNGVPIALVTSSDDKKMARVAEQQPDLIPRFDVIIDATKVTRSKPDPQGYLLGAEAIGVSPKDCYVFEDSLQGLKAARSSGAIVIGVATTYPRSVVESLSDYTFDLL